MKMVVLMYLEDDDAIVADLLEELKITTFSRMTMEGHGSGVPGWHGEVAPYRSAMVFAVLPDRTADALLDAVGAVQDVADPGHPLHAVKLDVEDVADSGSPRASA